MLTSASHLMMECKGCQSFQKAWSLRWTVYFSESSCSALAGLAEFHLSSLTALGFLLQRGNDTY